MSKIFGKHFFYSILIFFLLVLSFFFTFAKTNSYGEVNKKKLYKPKKSDIMNSKFAQGELLAMTPHKTKQPSKKLTSRAITHNSTQWFYKVLEPGKVKIILSVKNIKPDEVVINYVDNGTNMSGKLSYKGDEDNIHYFEITLELQTNEAWFDYSFIVTKGDKEFRCPASKEEVFTGYTGHIKNVPDWAKDVVWYQIFPERFRNGNPKNDPTLEDMKESDIKGWKIREWGSDWYATEEWEKENYKSVFQSIFQRRYGGDLQGIIDKLDYLQDLGITAIYINPVFRAPSLHKYDGSTFHHIDETFGPDPEGDKKLLKNANETDDPSTWVWTSADKQLLQLVKEAHKRNIKVIIDGVFNHSGRYFFAFEDIIKKGKDSKYKNWYTIKKWDPKNPDGFIYKAWFGVHSLPEFKRDKVTLNKEYKNYVFNITKRWMAPNGKVEDGIDGWRLDVAFCIPHGFWKEWRRQVKSINPDAYMTAEVVTIDSSFLRGDEFDAMMNYPFAFTLVEYFVDKKKKISTSEFDRRLKHLRDIYPEPITYVMQNLMSSHDSSRLRTLIVNPDMNYRNWEGHFNKSKIEHNKKYRIDAGSEEHRQIHKLIALFQMVYPGAPMIYYGDEVGMTGANDPDCRKPMLWDDIEYQDETVHPHKTRSKTAEKIAPDKDLLNHYKKMIKIRNENPALRRGDFVTLLTDDENDVYAFERNYKGDKIIIMINNSSREMNVPLKVKDGKFRYFVDILNNNEPYEINDGSLNVVVKPKWALILKGDRKK